MRGRMSQILNAIWYRQSLAWVLLWPLSCIYRVLFALSRRRGLRLASVSETPAVPVVIVGNITVGGTGKTPLVVRLVKELTRRNLRVGIIARGYRGVRSGTAQIVTRESDPMLVGDEAVLVARKTGRPVAVAADRREARDLLLARHQLDVVLSDDGLQHHRLARNLEIVVVDGARGLGNGHCLPAGPLREPAVRLRNADAVIINGPGWSYPGAIRATTRIVTVQRWRDGEERSIGELTGQTVHAYAGIGNPDRFFALLRREGIDVIEHPLADHASISAGETRFSADTMIMLTEKDAVKYRDTLGGDVWCVSIEIELEASDQERILTMIDDLVNGGS